VKYARQPRAAQDHICGTVSSDVFLLIGLNTNNVNKKRAPIGALSMMWLPKIRLPDVRLKFSNVFVRPLQAFECCAFGNGLIFLPQGIEINELFHTTLLSLSARLAVVGGTLGMIGITRAGK